MPQASDELRHLMTYWFGDLGTAVYEAIKVLESQGFVVTKNGLIVKPTQCYNPTWEQWKLIAFLVHEWDFVFEDRAPFQTEVDEIAASSKKHLDSSLGGH